MPRVDLLQPKLWRVPLRAPGRSSSRNSGQFRYGWILIIFWGSIDGVILQVFQGDEFQRRNMSG